MSEISGAAVSGTMILEELDGGSAGGEQASPPDPGPLHCGRCALWPRPQTWLCVVPLLIGFIGLGLSLMLLNWIVVGSVQDYVPTDLVDAKGIGQDPIFLSKPSAVPKNPHTTTSSGNPTVKIRPRPGIHPSVTPSTAPSTAPSRRTPHLHNRISTRLTTTTTHAPRQPPPAGRDVAPHSTTVHRVGSGSGRNAAPSSTRAAPPNASSSPYNHPLLQNSTHTWNHEHSSKGPSDTPTRPHLHVKTVAPTSPSLRSEHFKPCRDKDLAYCLNEGECFVIQTLTGSHKHCRCKEGYQGIRCDQFLPKTDSISSDPNHLGIEFMESKEVYKRQVLSISCITIGISLLGTLCIALYCQNKRRREKLQAHLKVSCSLKNPNVGFAPALTSKSSLRLQYGLQFQKHCKDPGFSPPHGGAVCGSNSCPAPPTHPKAPTTRKQSRSRSLSNSPGQKNRAPHHLTASRWTPPISRGRLNPIGGSRDSSHAYQHLQEVEGSEIEVQPLTRCNCSTVGSDPLQEEHFDMQQGERGEDRWGHAGMQFSRLDRATPLHQAPPPSLRACSVPIIPSFQGHDVTSCMQKNSPGRETCSPEGGASSQGTHPPASLTEVGSSGPRSDWEEEPRDGPWALPHTYREQEDKTDSLLLPAGSRAEGEAQKELSENQLVDYCGPAQHSKDCSQLCQ